MDFPSCFEIYSFQDIDEIGYITCERYDRPRRGVDYDSDDGEEFSGQITYDTVEARPRETNYVRYRKS